MSANKTEQPTPKRLREARRKGNVPFSRDANSVATYLAGLLVLTFVVAGLEGRFADLYQAALEGMAAIDRGEPIAALVKGAMKDSLRAVLMMSLPVLGVVASVGALAAFFQIGPVVSTEKIQPKLEKLDPIKQAKNIFGVKGFFELAKTLAKLLCVAGLGYLAVKGSLDVIIGAGWLSAEDVGAQIASIAKGFLISVAMVFAVVGLLDLAFQRWKWRKDLMMSRDEVQREYKQDEGDPQIKSRRRSIHQEILSEDLPAALRTADAVVVNPTHYAVVLEYKEGRMAAPRVTAKGVDNKARKIIRMARRRQVPVIRDVPLARALYLVELRRFVPEELFEGVAQVLLFAWKIRREGEDQFVVAPAANDAEAGPVAGRQAVRQESAGGTS